MKIKLQVNNLPKISQNCQKQPRLMHDDSSFGLPFIIVISFISFSLLMPTHVYFPDEILECLIGKRITKIFSIIIAMPNRVYKLIIVQTKDVSNKVWQSHISGTNSFRTNLLCPDHIISCKLNSIRLLPDSLALSTTTPSSFCLKLDKVSWVRVQLEKKFVSRTILIDLANFYLVIKLKL